ncbi:MAG TPA: helix-turn-helix domain-containing protein [Allosphingosinicella sp.]|jgi:hypothetical protein
MSVPGFLAFRPVPCGARHDGWSHERQLRFVVGLAKGLTPGRAAARLGMSRQSAYKLRKRAGAEDFAAAWDSAQLFARQARSGPAAGPPPQASRPTPRGATAFDPWADHERRQN